MKPPHKMLSRLFPEPVVTEEIHGDSLPGTLYPEEAACITQAVPKRRQEFTAGRLCARQALARLGIHNFPLIMGPDRAPVWPVGIVGSISHTHGYCGVAVARQSEIRSLGLDVERTDQAGREIWPRICTPEELSRVQSHPATQQRELATLIFSAKECFYKCQYQVSRSWVGFHDVELSIHLEAGQFDVRLLIDIDGFFSKGASLRGKFLFHSDYVFTAMTLTMTTHSTG